MARKQRINYHSLPYPSSCSELQMENDINYANLSLK
jgi:hypothetical protein